LFIGICTAGIIIVGYLFNAFQFLFRGLRMRYLERKGRAGNATAAMYGLKREAAQLPKVRGAVKFSVPAVRSATS
jgi:hypothetical protein